eukprot:SAG22_NODE_2482_length_2526_cov_1.823651_3_plen_251_part_00
MTGSAACSAALAAVLACCCVGGDGALLIAPDATNMQYIGRMEDGPGGTKRFDMPGCEVRALLKLSQPATVSVKIAQKHGSPPAKTDPGGGGNSQNSGFEANAFVAWVDGKRLGAGGHNATFTTYKNQTEAPYEYSLGRLAAGSHAIRVLKATEADWNGGSPVPNYITFYGIAADGGGEEDAAAAGGGELVATLAPPPPLPTRKIEFLGDSITAGFCNECLAPDTVASDKEAYGGSWDFQIGQILGAQVQC